MASKNENNIDANFEPSFFDDKSSIQQYSQVIDDATRAALPTTADIGGGDDASSIMNDDGSLRIDVSLSRFISQLSVDDYKTLALMATADVETGSESVNKNAALSGATGMSNMFECDLLADSVVKKAVLLVNNWKSIRSQKKESSASSDDSSNTLQVSLVDKKKTAAMSKNVILECMLRCRSFVVMTTEEEKPNVENPSLLFAKLLIKKKNKSTKSGISIMDFNTMVDDIASDAYNDTMAMLWYNTSLYEHVIGDFQSSKLSVVDREKIRSEQLTGAEKTHGNNNNNDGDGLLIPMSRILARCFVDILYNKLYKMEFKVEVENDDQSHSYEHIYADNLIYGVGNESSMNGIEDDEEKKKITNASKMCIDGIIKSISSRGGIAEIARSELRRVKTENGNELAGDNNAMVGIRTMVNSVTSASLNNEGEPKSIHDTSAIVSFFIPDENSFYISFNNGKKNTSENDVVPRRWFDFWWNVIRKKVISSPSQHDGEDTLDENDPSITDEEKIRRAELSICRKLMFSILCPTTLMSHDGAMALIDDERDSQFNTDAKKNKHIQLLHDIGKSGIDVSAIQSFIKSMDVYNFVNKHMDGDSHVNRIGDVNYFVNLLEQRYNTPEMKINLCLFVQSSLGSEKKLQYDDDNMEGIWSEILSTYCIIAFTISTMRSNRSALIYGTHNNSDNVNQKAIINGGNGLYDHDIGNPARIGSACRTLPNYIDPSLLPDDMEGSTRMKEIGNTLSSFIDIIRRCKSSIDELVASGKDKSRANKNKVDITTDNMKAEIEKIKNDHVMKKLDTILQDFFSTILSYKRDQVIMDNESELQASLAETAENIRIARENGIVISQDDVDFLTETVKRSFPDPFSQKGISISINGCVDSSGMGGISKANVDYSVKGSSMDSLHLNTIATWSDIYKAVLRAIKSIVEIVQNTEVHPEMDSNILNIYTSFVQSYDDRHSYACIESMFMNPEISILIENMLISVVKERRMGLKAQKLKAKAKYSPSSSSSSPSKKIRTSFM